MSQVIIDDSEIEKTLEDLGGLGPDDPDYLTEEEKALFRKMYHEP